MEEDEVSRKGIIRRRRFFIHTFGKNVYLYKYNYIVAKLPQKFRISKGAFKLVSQTVGPSDILRNMLPLAF